MKWLWIVVSLAVLVNISLAAPQACTAEGKSCVKGKSYCDQGKCVCKPPNVWGDPTFNCYRQNTVAAEMKNDPQFTTFNNETISFPFPCRYLGTHVEQELKDGSRKVIGKCEVQVSAFNAKGRGKFFLNGFDVALKLLYKDGRVVQMSSRHFGLARSGSFQFRSWGSMGEYKPDGPWGKDQVGYEDADNNIKVEVYQDEDNNQLVYEAKRCGLRITFVPYDLKDRRSQVSIPGLAVEINCAHHPIWLSYDDVTFLAPHWQKGAMLADHKINGLTEEQSMVVRAFDRGFVQNQPFSDRGQCAAVRDSLRSCSRRQLRDAIKNCYWMLEQPRFIYCIDKSKSARKILNLFSQCVDVWCGSTSCRKVRRFIRRHGCDTIPEIDELALFMAGQMCP